MKVVKRGSIKTKSTLLAGQPKEEVGSEEDSTALDPIIVPKGHVVGVIKWSDSFRAVHGYQTFGIDVGVEFPFSMKPGDLKAMKEMFPVVEEMVDEVMASKVKEAPAVLKRLIGMKKLVSG